MTTQDKFQQIKGFHDPDEHDLGGPREPDKSYQEVMHEGLVHGGMENNGLWKCGEFI